MSNAKRIVDDMIHKISLDILNSASDVKNFEVLECLIKQYPKGFPVSNDKLNKIYKLTKMPLHRRLNELQRVGLIKRNGKKNLCEITDLGFQVIEFIKELKKEVKTNLKELINLDFKNKK